MQLWPSVAGTRLGNGDRRDCKSDNERAAWWAATSKIQRSIRVLSDGPYTAKASRLLADCETQLAVILQKDGELARAIADAPDPMSIPDTRERDPRNRAPAASPVGAARALRDGRLLIAPDVAAERRADVEQRIAELQARITREDAVFAAAVAQAERLLA